MFALKIMKKQQSGSVVVGYVIKIGIESPLYMVLDSIKREIEKHKCVVDEEETVGMYGVFATISNHVLSMNEKEYRCMGQPVKMCIGSNSYKNDGFYLPVIGERAAKDVDRILSNIDSMLQNQDVGMWQHIDGDVEVLFDCVCNFAEYKFMEPVIGAFEDALPSEINDSQITSQGSECAFSSDKHDISDLVDVSFTKEEEQEIFEEVRKLVYDKAKNKAVFKKIKSESAELSGITAGGVVTYKLDSLSEVFNLPILRGCVVSDSNEALYLRTPVILDEFLDRHTGSVIGEHVVLTGQQVANLRKAMNANFRTVKLSSDCTMDEESVSLAKKLCKHISNEDYEYEEK